MNIVVAVPVDEALASFLGKKSSEDSIAFYNRKAGDNVLVALFPRQEDEKVYALAESLLMSSRVALSTSALDKRFGEALVACSVLGRRVFVTDDNDASDLIRSAGLKEYSVVPKAELIEKLMDGAQPAADGPTRVDLDKAFPVRGIGTVALGVVTRGVVKQHDKLFHTSGREVLVRSIQSQDEDVESAGVGTRVGLSLKEIGDREIEKGDLLTANQVKKSGRISVDCRTSAIAKESIAEGGLYGVASNFSYSECVVKKVDGRRLDLELKAPMPIEEGDEVLIIRSKVPRIFAAGRVVGKG
ncbi:MAG: hypothetical protein M1286_00520 [Candidatus Marsarchaeota archaeon]|nr:hypothetical protein [Candidatus Marsarchaeota archaeon]